MAFNPNGRITDSPAKPKETFMESVSKGFADVQHSLDDAHALWMGSKTGTAFSAEGNISKAPKSDKEVQAVLLAGVADTHKLYGGENGDKAEAHTFGKVLKQSWDPKKQLDYQAA